MHTNRFRTLALLLVLVTAASGCGQMGPLTLPDAQQAGTSPQDSDDDDEER